MILATLLAACLASGAEAEPAAARAHPFLFTTPASIERSRRALRENERLAAAGEGLLRRARAARYDELPDLDDEWWEEEGKTLPWSETYPEINRFTGEAPRAWAGYIEGCTLAGVFYDDSALREKAKRALLGLSGYSFSYEHFDAGMNYVTWGLKALDCYDILYNTFDAGERRRMDAFFERMVRAVARNDAFWVEEEPGGPLNNHYVWHKLGLVMYGLFYDDEEMVREAIFGPKGIETCLRHGFTDGGLWLEASINYQFAATSPMLMVAELLENAGAPLSLWDYATDDGRTLRQSYDALFETLFPDTTLPNIGDCYGRRARLGAHSDYERLYTRFREDRYAWALRAAGGRGLAALRHGVPALPEAQGPSVHTAQWPEHGYVMLRGREGKAYWTGAGYTVFGTYSNAPVHQNADKLSIMLFADKRHWLVDVEARAGVYHAFSAAVQRELNRETLCHNTVMVDRASQRHPARQLDLVEFHALPGAKRMTIGDLDGQLYDGVRQLRTVLVLDRYVLDVFQVESGEERLFEWVAHIDGESSGSSVNAWENCAFPQSGPMKWLKAPRRAPSGETYAEVFEKGGDRFHLDLFVPGGARVTACGFPRNDSPESDTSAMRLAGVRGTRACFVALYRTGAEKSGAALALEEGALGSLVVRVQADGEARSHVVPALSSRR